MLDDLLDDELEQGEESPQSVMGIDLGTTNSVAAIVRDGVVEVVLDPDGNALHPSVVAFLPGGRSAVGVAARSRRIIDPVNTIFSAKRIIGQPFGSPGVTAAIAMLPYEVVEGDNREPLIVARGRKHTVPEISSHVLSYIRELAAAQLGEPIVHCVITVPANFSDGQRHATRQAAEMAGLQVLRILNEPTSAALAYGQQRDLHQRLAVFDMGGGTFDVTLLAVREKLYEVIATGGDPFLGGDDMDRVVADALALQVLREHRMDPNADPEARARLVVAAEQIKMKLSEQLAVEGTIDRLGYGANGVEISHSFRMERAEFEELVAPFVDRAIGLTERVLEEAGLSAERIDEIILVGGATRVPLVRRRVAERFGRRPRLDLDPMQVVAIGAALQAHSLYAPAGGQAEIGVLMDITSHSLRIATTGGFSEVLIPKNTTIPAEGSKVFSTARDDQTRVELMVCQGESKKFDENAVLGTLVLDDLPPGRRGDVQLEVEFLIDADGLLQVAARDRASGKSARASLSVVGTSGAR